MALPFKVKDLEKVPEAARALYEKKGDEYVLQVEGAKGEDEISGLSSALERLKRENQTLKTKAERVSDEDLTDLEQLRKDRKDREEGKLKDEGKWEDLRARLQTEHQTALTDLQTKLAARDKVIENLTVKNELRSAITKAGIQPEYADAVEALLERKGPKVAWDGETPKGVVPDAVHGDQPIGAFVEKWAKSDDAKRFMPVGTKGGGGAPGTEGKPGSGKSWENKKYGDMSIEEKKEYLAEQYGEKATA